jgi:peptidoglycan-associated lipoprotein
MRDFGARAAALAVAGLLSACSSTPPAKTEAAPAPSAPKAAEAPKPMRRAEVKPAPALAPSSASTLPPYLDPKNPISSDRSVYFAFDRSNLSSEGSATILRQGNYLASAPQVSVRIEGNCDERGGSEYNLALGQRRADAVAGRLRALGVRPAQMQTVSYGKEKPREAGHNEAAWRQNRRADIVYPER